MSRYYRWMAGNEPDEKAAAQLGMKAAQLETGVRTEQEFLGSFLRFNGQEPTPKADTPTTTENDETDHDNG